MIRSIPGFSQNEKPTGENDSQKVGTSMHPNYNLPPEAVEAAVRAYKTLRTDAVQWDDEYTTEAVILAFLDAMGVTVERQYFPPHGGHIIEGPPPNHQRLVSRWFPAEGSS